MSNPGTDTQSSADRQHPVVEQFNELEQLILRDRQNIDEILNKGKKLEEAIDDPTATSDLYEENAEGVRNRIADLLKNKNKMRGPGKKRLTEMLRTNREKLSRLIPGLKKKSTQPHSGPEPAPDAKGGEPKKRLTHAEWDEKALELMSNIYPRWRALFQILHGKTNEKARKFLGVSSEDEFERLIAEIEQKSPSARLLIVAKNPLDALIKILKTTDKPIIIGPPLEEPLRIQIGVIMKAIAVAQKKLRITPPKKKTTTAKGIATTPNPAQTPAPKPASIPDDTASAVFGPPGQSPRVVRGPQRNINTRGKATANHSIITASQNSPILSDTNAHTEAEQTISNYGEWCLLFRSLHRGQDAEVRQELGVQSEDEFNDLIRLIRSKNGVSKQLLDATTPIEALRTILSGKSGGMPKIDSALEGPLNSHMMIIREAIEAAKTELYAGRTAQPTAPVATSGTRPRRTTLKHATIPFTPPGTPVRPAPAPAPTTAPAQTPTPAPTAPPAPKSYAELHTDAERLMPTHFKEWCELFYALHLNGNEDEVESDAEIAKRREEVLGIKSEDEFNELITRINNAVVTAFREVGNPIDALENVFGEEPVFGTALDAKLDGKIQRIKGAIAVAKTEMAKDAATNPSVAPITRADILGDDFLKIIYALGADSNSRARGLEQAGYIAMGDRELRILIQHILIVNLHIDVIETADALDDKKLQEALKTKKNFDIFKTALMAELTPKPAPAPAPAPAPGPSNNQDLRRIAGTANAAMKPFWEGVINYVGGKQEDEDLIVRVIHLHEAQYANSPQARRLNNLQTNIFTLMHVVATGLSGKSSDEIRTEIENFFINGLRPRAAELTRALEMVETSEAIEQYARFHTGVLALDDNFNRLSCILQIDPQLDIADTTARKYFEENSLRDCQKLWGEITSTHPFASISSKTPAEKVDVIADIKTRLATYEQTFNLFMNEVYRFLPENIRRLYMGFNRPAPVAPPDPDDPADDPPDPADTPDPAATEAPTDSKEISPRVREFLENFLDTKLIRNDDPVCLAINTALTGRTDLDEIITFLSNPDNSILPKDRKAVEDDRKTGETNPKMKERLEREIDQLQEDEEELDSQLEALKGKINDIIALLGGKTDEGAARAQLMEDLKKHREDEAKKRKQKRVKTKEKQAKGQLIKTLDVLIKHEANRTPLESPRQVLGLIMYHIHKNDKSMTPETFAKLIEDAIDVQRNVLYSGTRAWFNKWFPTKFLKPTLKSTLVALSEDKKLTDEIGENVAEKLHELGNADSYKKVSTWVDNLATATDKKEKKAEVAGHKRTTVPRLIAYLKVAINEGKTSSMIKTGPARALVANLERVHREQIKADVMEEMEGRRSSESDLFDAVTKKLSPKGIQEAMLLTLRRMEEAREYTNDISRRIVKSNLRKSFWLNTVAAATPATATGIIAVTSLTFPPIALAALATLGVTSIVRSFNKNVFREEDKARFRRTGTRAVLSSALVSGALLLTGPVGIGLTVAGAGLGLASPEIAKRLKDKPLKTIKILTAPIWGVPWLAYKGISKFFGEKSSEKPKAKDEKKPEKKEEPKKS